MDYKFKLPINKSIRERSEIATEKDLDESIYKILQVVQIAPISADLTVGNDGNIAYGYRSPLSEVSAYGSLDTIDIIYSKVIALRVLNDDSSQAYIVFDKPIPYSSIKITYNDSSIVILTSDDSGIKFEEFDPDFTNYIVASDGTAVTITLEFIK